MIMIRRCLIFAMLCLLLTVPHVVAAQWTVYPTTQSNCTGNTDYAAKYDGPVLISGGPTAGAVRKSNGYLKFDTSAVPDSTSVTRLEFNFYVTNTIWPYWSITPLVADPASLAGSPDVVWEDLEAERVSGYYNRQNESSVYMPGWKSLALGGTANDDLTALLVSGQDWFAFGGICLDGESGYYIHIDGHSGVNPPYLVVQDTPAPVNDTCAGAIVVPGVPGNHVYPGDITFAADDYNCNAPCVGNLPHGGPDVAYAITLPAGWEVCATIDQGAMDWNGGVYLVTDCNDVDGSCVAGSSGWLAGSADETFCYRAPDVGTYYIIVDGRSGGGTGAFQLDVEVSSLIPPSDLVCTEIGNQVNLSWTNNDAYDLIEVYVDGDLLQTVPGVDTTLTVALPETGYRCFHLCALAGPDSACCEPCCLIYGYDWVELLWDFDADDGGFLVEGTGSWEWGEATYGPCSLTAAGRLWGTVLHQEYHPKACWLLDSPPVDTGFGCFMSFDHCYETEFGADGGVLWFTTDDFWYNTSEPVKGADGVITATPSCIWVAGKRGFTGDSGGWVTDHWDFTDPKWHEQSLSLRFAFGSDDFIGAPGWMIDNVTIYRNPGVPSIDCDYTVSPLSGTVAFQTIHRITLSNLQVGGTAMTRRVAGRIAMTLGSGTTYNPWRAGFTNIAPSSTFYSQFPVNLPALGSVIGTNTFVLSAMDVTPAPYNQPPYPPSGWTCTKTNVVVANAP